jgi:UDP-2-acetamido-2-deoxy-ribo-hexuluronate aminotransferase
VQFLDLKAQHARYAREIEQRMLAVVARAEFIMGPEVAALEEALAERVGVAHCVSVASGTQALELALRALGVGPGDEVITVAFSWISSAEVIALVGATPVFVDIDPRGFGLDPRELGRAFSPRTRAVLPVSLYGQTPDLTAIEALADTHGVPVIEDAAQSFGARHGGRASGGITRVGCTSFFPSKPLGCFGDGGALFSDDAALAQTLRAMRSHGSLDRKVHDCLGMNARLDTLQAAVLLAKLPHFEAELSERRRLAMRYTSALGGHFDVPEVLPGNEHVFAQYTIRSKRRDAVAQALQAQGIPTRVHYARCLHQQPVFARLEANVPQAERAAREVLSLPLYPGLQDADQDRVIEALLEQAVVADP